jgi:peptide/nickel transport system permease protein
MSQLKYIGARLLKAVVLIALIAALNFFLVRLAPGDPASVMAGESGAADPLYIQQLREQFRLDEPLPVQLWTYMSGIARLDLGYSYRNQAPVIDLLVQRLPATLLLTSVAFAMSIVSGVAMGAVSASYLRQWPDKLVGAFCLFLYATPLYWIGLMLVLLFSVVLNWFPAFGAASVQNLDGWAYLHDRLSHLALPATTLALYYFSIYTRLTRSSMIDVQNQEYVKMAKAKGLPPFRVATAHVLRNALLPVVTFAGIQAGHLIGGSILVETVFAWPGIGRLALDSLLVRDYNTLLGVFFLCSVMTVLFNLIADVFYTVVDPRIEVG